MVLVITAVLLSGPSDFSGPSHYSDHSGPTDYSGPSDYSDLRSHLLIIILHKFTFLHSHLIYKLFHFSSYHANYDLKLDVNYYIIT